LNLCVFAEMLPCASVVHDGHDVLELLGRVLDLSSEKQAGARDDLHDRSVC